MLPNYLVVGAARCGTSWIARNLMVHPDVYMPPEKELHFFDREYRRGIQWYESRFQGRAEAAVGEATPAYFYFPQIPDLIRRHMPRARLIVSLRDPVDRAYSHYWNLRAKARWGDENYWMPFEEKLRRTPRLIQEGLYATNLRRYLGRFPREQVLVLLYDDLRRDPRAFLKAVYDHLGVEPVYREGLVTQQVNGSASKLGRSRLLYKLYRGALRMRLFDTARRIDAWNRQQVNEVSPLTRAMLLEQHYHREIEELQDMLERDLKDWLTV